MSYWNGKPVILLRRDECEKAIAALQNRLAEYDSIAENQAASTSVLRGDDRRKGGERCDGVVYTVGHESWMLDAKPNRRKSTQRVQCTNCRTDKDACQCEC